MERPSLHVCTVHMVLMCAYRRNVKTMMIVLLLACVFGIASSQLPHGVELKHLVDAGFGRLDHNPQDGSVTENEWDVIVLYDDANNDSCISHDEYTQAHQTMPHEVADKMFHHFDHNTDGCLDTADMSAEFHLIDHNGNNMVDMHEWDQYFTHLVTKLFGHGAGHGGH